MNTRTLTFIFTIFVLLLCACGAAATEAPIAMEPQVVEKIVEEVVVEEEPAQRQLPEPTQAPIGSKPSPADNFFKDYGVNPFLDTSEDHLSTFGLDVDTASYTVARRYVNDGNLPPFDAVRVEEFVNFFEPGYPKPQDVAFGIYADGAPSPFQYDGSYLLRFGVQGYDIPDEERKPASLIFVIDVSGSMEKENRLSMVKRSLELLVNRLHPRDTVGIVAYGTEARKVLEPTSAAEKNQILDAIYSLNTEGSTNAEAGLQLGFDMASEAFRPDGINRVILLSDGVANVGATGPDEILESIGRYSDQGINLSTFGFGMGNFNDVLMEQLADKGDGSYSYIDNLEEAQRLFVDNLSSTLQTIAMNTKVQVDFNPEVVSRYRLIGYENRAIADEEFRNDQVDAGELGAGHSASALYAIQLIPGTEGRIATVSLRWEDPDTREVKEINGNFNTWDLEASFEEADPYYQLAVVVAQYAELLRQSPWAAETSIYQIQEHIERIASLLPEDAQVQEFADLVRRASEIKALQRR